MKINVMTDLEGPAMVGEFAQTRDFKDNPERKREAMTLLTQEVNAAVDGILDAQPDAEVIVCDGHGNGGIDRLAFHPRAKLFVGNGPKKPYLLDAATAALFFVGQHAMAGTENAPLCHTYSSKSIEYFKINGRLVGEFGARAMLAGTMGIPAVFVSGDDKAVAEARALVPRIHGAIVKIGLGLELALHLSPPAARALIRAEAAQAIRDIGTIEPLKVTPPYEQEICFKEGIIFESYLKQGAQQIDERTIRWSSDDLSKLYV